MTPRDLEILQNIYIDAGAELALESGSGFREVAFKDLLEWYRIMSGDQLPGEIPLGDFDVESVMDMFADWVKKDFKDYQPKKPVK